MDDIIVRAATPAANPSLPGALRAARPLPWDLSSADYLERLFADAQGNVLCGALAGATGAPAAAMRRRRSHRD
jgi:hypothetical protein